MGKHRAPPVASHDPARLAGTLLLTSALAVGSLSTPAKAHATCLALGGFDLGSGCTSSDLVAFAIAFGPGATADADGLGVSLPACRFLAAGSTC
jgi:hypothetical protein